MEIAPSTRSSLLIRLRDPSDEPAWSEFVEIYEPLIIQLARRKGLQEADAQDLSQEVFRAVARAIERFEPDPVLGTFRGWLFRIANNLIINLLAAQRRHPRGSGDTDMIRMMEAQPDPTMEESALFRVEYQRRLLTWAAARVRYAFSDAIWTAFWMTSVEGRPPRDVADSLGMSIGTVYQYKSRVVARIRREIEHIERESGTDLHRRLDDGSTSGPLR